MTAALLVPLMTPLLAGLVACQPTSTAQDSSSTDGGVADGGVADGGVADGGVTDGGVADGGVADGGGADGGVMDGGTTDGGAADGGSSDGGAEDPALAVVVNELMADNGGSTLNEEALSEDGLYADWVELYNPGDVAVDLSGYGVSDDWTTPLAYLLPSGTVIEAGGYLLLWAEGAALPSGLHLPFKLSSTGESVGLFTPTGDSIDWVSFGFQEEDTAWARLPDGSDNWESVDLGTPGATNQRVTLTETEVVSSGAVWKYWDLEDGPGLGWTDRGFDDSAWSSGPAPIGYGETLSTTISYGPNASAKYTTAWFRTSFAVDPGEGEITGGTLSIRVDDSAAVYLDGEEIVRQNLPDGVLTADTFASSTISGSAETSWTSHAISARTLEDGEAVVAVEVHQASLTSSDLVLDLSLTVERIEAKE